MKYFLRHDLYLGCLRELIAVISSPCLRASVVNHVLEEKC